MCKTFVPSNNDIQITSSIKDRWHEMPVCSKTTKHPQLNIFHDIDMILYVVICIHYVKPLM